MRLIHYTDEEFDLIPMEYNQSEVVYHAKPNGLWVSVEGEEDWKWWCEAEGFNLQNLNVSYEVKLQKNANILYLNSEEELYEFTMKYPYQRRESIFCHDSSELDWGKIKEEYQGILIPKYFWDCRLSLDSGWYYGWDCASGCIWDLKCIEEFKLLEANDLEMLQERAP